MAACGKAMDMELKVHQGWVMIYKSLFRMSDVVEHMRCIIIAIYLN